ncbi:MAG TPA: thioesterase family protein [Acidimicrobiales bacterium]|nr:thioesterase family protein [Acidimicrobiales bacterium]
MHEQLSRQALSDTAPDGEALFVPDGPFMVPTERSRGPWSPKALHGGPVAALGARAIEVAAGESGLQVVRVTVELLRPVPLVPLKVQTSLFRPGKRVQLRDAVIEADGTAVAALRALSIRVAPDYDGRLPTLTEPEPAPDGPENSAPGTLDLDERPAFHNQGAELRFVAGGDGQPGPATVWIRLRQPVVAGEPPTPLQRAMAAADFGNGVSAELEFRSASFINPDLTVSLLRPPVGEWVCLDARTRLGTPGIGSAQSTLWDVTGRVGTAVQSLLVELGP